MNIETVTKKASDVMLLMVSKIIDTLFPPRCVLTQQPVDAAHSFSVEAWQRVQFIARPYCECCGHPFEFDMGEGALCGDCIYDEPPYDRARAAMQYDRVTRPLVTRFKYSDQTHAMPAYVQLLQTAGAEMLAKADAMIPVPLHRRRLLSRKYNQSLLLAHGLSERCGVSVWADALLRVKHTPPQAGLTRAQRQKNMQGAFKANPEYHEQLHGASVMLIDDVMTTGATLKACTKALKKAGAEWVGVLTLARRVKGS